MLTSLAHSKLSGVRLPQSRVAGAGPGPGPRPLHQLPTSPCPYATAPPVVCGLQEGHEAARRLGR